MKKTTLYARKRRAPERRQYNSAEWLNVIQRCTGYSPDAPVGSWLDTGTQDAADNAVNRVMTAFASIKTGQTAANNEEPFDLIAHALGVSCMRAGQIAGTEPEQNIMLPPLIAANATLRKVLDRRRKWGKWEMLPAEVEAVDYALEIYETIVRASSPAQMASAVDLRLQALKGRTLETLETTA